MTPGTETPTSALPPPTVAVVVITLNEADRLSPAIESCRDFADELLVIDSGSRDGTPDLARTLGARVILHPFSDFADQKNFAMAQATSSWIFSLDADERVSADLAAAIAEFKRRPPSSLPAGFAIARKSAYLGRWIEHSGWYPDRKVRLFRREGAHWQGRVHERLSLPGPVGRLPGEILHHTYRDIADHLRKINTYTSFQAEKMAGRSSLRLLLSAFILPPVTFLRHYCWKRGALDGFPGLVIAVLSAWATALKNLKAIERRRPPRPPD